MHKRTHSTADWRKWKKKRKEYDQKIKNAKYNTWKAYVESADEESIWKITDYMSSKPTQQYIPIINEKATTNEEKVNQFRQTLLPSLATLPLAKMSDIKKTRSYLEPTPCTTTIMKQQLSYWKTRAR